MEPQNKIIEDIKAAVRKKESESFDAMDRVWDRVEARLDEEQKKKVFPFRRLSIAAAILILIGLGAGIYKSLKPSVATSASWATVKPLPESVPGELPKNSNNVASPLSSEAVTAINNGPMNNGESHPPHIAKAYLSSHNKPVWDENTIFRQQNESNGTVAIQEDESLKLVKGKVVDVKGEAVPGALIMLKGQTGGAISDIDGNFEIPVSTHHPEISIKALGLKELTIALDKNVNMVKAVMATATLPEAEVVVYNKKGDRSSMPLKGDSKTAKHPMVDLFKALDGTAPGTSLNDRGAQYSGSYSDAYSNNSSVPFSSDQYDGLNNRSETNGERIQPGVIASKAADNKIAGNDSELKHRSMPSLNPDNGPMVIVDGTPYNGTLKSIDPKEVESTTFVNDATTKALYGARGANGVFIINTKKHQLQGKNKTLLQKIKGIFNKDNNTGDSLRAVPKP